MPTSTSEPGAPGLITQQARRVWREISLNADPRRRRWLAAMTFSLVLLIGLFDYLTGYEISLFVFYCVPVVIGTAALGWRFGTTTAVLSVVVGLAGDYAAGARYSSPFVPVLKGSLAFLTYLVFVWLFDTVQMLQLEMEERVRQRTSALTAEIAERKRLERTLLEISERERATIGRELHDDLGQHLTGTAFAGQVLGEKLEVLGLAERADAQRVVALIEEAIEKTRHLARGLLLAEVPPGELETALRELAADASGRRPLACEFRAEGECHLADSRSATNLLRIAQEAVNNAFRHGKARHVVITLHSRPDGLELAVRDDGGGIPPPPVRGRGLGLDIMAHRAQIIGGEFLIEPAPGGGTIARCRLLQPRSTDDT